MLLIQEYLEIKQNLLLKNKLFQYLEWGVYQLEDFSRLAYSISFWVMSFQDLLRINLSQINDKQYYQIVRQHLMEDVGHDNWFLYDLKAMNLEQPSLQILYSKPHTAVRDATFSLMSEVFRATYDYERIVLVLTLESAGHIFFESVADFVEKHNYTNRLKYFSHHHLSVEKSHEIFEKQIQSYLNNIQLSHDEELQVLNMIDRVYKAFELMFDGLAIALSTTTRFEVAN